jgi:hypothetical protein
MMNIAIHDISPTLSKFLQAQNKNFHQLISVFPKPIYYKYVIQHVNVHRELSFNMSDPVVVAKPASLNDPKTGVSDNENAGYIIILD